MSGAAGRARTRDRRRGSAMVEFALAGIASVFMLICTVQLALGMWNYHTLAYAVHEVTRFAAVHGKGCTNPGNSCAISVGTIANRFRSAAIGIPADSVSVTLTTDSGVQTVCNPLNTCFTDGTIWPPALNKDNYEGKNITVSARYRYRSALLFFFPGAGTQEFGAIWFPASSTQKIVY